jgi:hypothetical protein
MSVSGLLEASLALDQLSFIEWTEDGWLELG